MDEYLLDGEIPIELIKESENLSRVNTIHRVYFDKDSGEILSISNEYNIEHLHYFDVESKDLEEVFGNTVKYRVKFDAEDKPSIVLKSKEDISSQFLIKVDEIDNWDNELTVEQYPLLKKWGCQLREDKRSKFLTAGVNAKLEFYVVNPENKNYIIRTLSLNLLDLYHTERIYFPFFYKEEENTSLEVYTKKFLKTVGFRRLYDTDD
jgi:hypothetical protein